MSHLFSLSPSAVLCPHILKKPNSSTWKRKFLRGLFSPLPRSVVFITMDFSDNGKDDDEVWKRKRELGRKWTLSFLEPLPPPPLFPPSPSPLSILFLYAPSSKRDNGPKRTGRGTTPLHLFINHKPFDANIYSGKVSQRELGYGEKTRFILGHLLLPSEEEKR